MLSKKHAWLNRAWLKTEEMKLTIGCKCDCAPASHNLLSTYWEPLQCTHLNSKYAESEPDTVNTGEGILKFNHLSFILDIFKY